MQFGATLAGSLQSPSGPGPRVGRSSTELITPRAVWEQLKIRSILRKISYVYGRNAVLTVLSSNITLGH